MGAKRTQQRRLGQAHPKLLPDGIQTALHLKAFHLLLEQLAHLHIRAEIAVKLVLDQAGHIGTRQADAQLIGLFLPEQELDQVPAVAVGNVREVMISAAAKHQGQGSDLGAGRFLVLRAGLR